LKNKLQQFGLDCWLVLTEVPGWPDAPRRLRLRRLLPAVLPVIAMLLLFLWSQLWTQPRIHAKRQTYQPLLALEQQVAELQLAGTDTAATETAERAAEAARMLLQNPKQLVSVLDELAKAARTHDWEATFQTQPVPPAPQASEAPMYFINARGKLVPTAGNTQPFASLLVFLEQLSPQNRSIDLTRLTIRADEQGRQTVEVALRAGCRIPE